MARTRTSEKEEAIARLREWLKPGQTVYLIGYASPSGMSGFIRPVLLEWDSERGEVLPSHPTWAFARASGGRLVERRGHDWVQVHGCGYDRGQWLVEAVGWAVFGEDRALKHHWL